MRSIKNTKNLNALFGLNAGIASYYNKTVSKDQNGQLSMAIKDFRGKLVATSLLGTVDTVSKALILNDEVPETKQIICTLYSFFRQYLKAIGLLSLSV